MKRMLVWRLGLRVGWLALPALGAGAETLSFQPDPSGVFPNPERGFHSRYELVHDTSVNDYANPDLGIEGFSRDALDFTFTRARVAGNTLVHSYIHLDKFVDAPDLPPALLASLQEGLDAVRRAGMKAILRPTYAWSESPAVPEDRILRHMKQLNPVIAANADVVFALEAGWLGPWGEWHSARYCVPGDEGDATTRYRIIAGILETTPDTLPLEIRYPVFIRELDYLVENQLVPPGAPVLTAAQRDRVGFHNDGFLADKTDLGTYNNSSWMDAGRYIPTAEKRRWMYDRRTSTGFNTLMGGETANSFGNNDAAGVTVQKEMAQLHTTELNEDYAEVNIDRWKVRALEASGDHPAETIFARLKRRMGYRITLVTADLSLRAGAGRDYTVAATLRNDGYAGFIKPRPVYLTFDDGSHRYDIPLPGLEVRAWLAGAVAVVPQTVTLPATMVPGTYTVALWLPDPAPSLQATPAYSVRFANAGDVWAPAQGYNILARGVEVGR